MSAIVPIVITNGQKYSIEALPGDPWETRRAKQIIRAIIRAKNSIRPAMTTQDLARACSSYLGEADAVKTGTLNGLFAGTRKSISAQEVEMFASVLYMDVLELLYPAGEQVEVRPGQFKNSADALADAIMPPVMDNPMRFGRTEAIVTLVRTAGELEDSTARAIVAIKTGATEYISISIQHIRYLALALKEQHSALGNLDSQGLQLTGTVRWALSMFEQGQITPEFLLSLEPLFAGHSVGDYRIGGPSHG